MPATWSTDEDSKITSEQELSYDIRAQQDQHPALEQGSAV
jgi:hypothetical protein